MAELTEEQCERVLPVFLKAYNAQRGTHFDLGQKVESVDKSVDYYFVNPVDNELKVQWTTPPSDAEERKAVIRDSTFLDDLRSALEQAGLNGIMVVVVHGDLPYQRDQLQALVAEAVRFIVSVRETEQPIDRDIEFSRRELTDQSSLLGSYLSELVLIPNPDKEAVPWCGLSSNLASAVPSSASRVEESFLHKVARYGPSAHDLVLVIHFDMDSYYEDEIETMRARLDRHLNRFREVWTFRDSVSRELRADCVKE